MQTAQLLVGNYLIVIIVNISLDMKWLIWQDTNRDFLLALHSNNSLILWNSDTGEKIWDYKFSTSVFKFSVDPFETSNIACKL